MQYDWTSAARHPGQTRSVLTTNGVDQVMAALQALPPEERHRVVRAAQGHTDLLKTMLGAPVGGQGQADEQRQLASEWLRAVMIAPRGLAANFAQTDVVRRALSSDVSEGGYLLPSYVTSLMAAPPVAPSLFPHVTKIPVGTGSGWVPTNSADLEFTWGDEGGSIDEISPSVGRCQFAIKKMSGLIRGSNEWFDDGTDAVNFIMGVMAQAASDSRDKAIAIGSGVGEPLGLLSADGVTDLPITTLTYANLVSLKESVDQRFHGDPSFAFFGNQRVRAKLHSIVDSNVRPIFLNDATTAFKDQLFGYPYRTNRFFPNSFIGCGSLRHYLWFDRRQMSIATSREASNAFTTDSTLVRLIERADGKVPELAADAFARATGLTGIS